MIKQKLYRKFLPLLISLSLIFYTFFQIDIYLISYNLYELDFFLIIISSIFFILSQFLSSIRLLYIFQKTGIDIKLSTNNKLYLLGMFYNFFLPGGIGGDAYKVILLKKKFKTKSLIKSIFLDRAIGYGAIFSLLILIIDEKILFINIFLKIFLFIILVFFGYYISSIIFKSGNIFFKSFLYSILIQILQIISMLLIIKSFELNTDELFLISIFLISSILSILSVGGIGIREFIFLNVSSLITIDQENLVLLALMFTLITAFVSLFGVIYTVRPKRLTL